MATHVAFVPPVDLNRNENLHTGSGANPSHCLAAPANHFVNVDPLPADRPPLHDLPVNTSLRRLQQVSTLLNRKIVIAWMIEDEAIHGFAGLNGRTIQAFPEHFRGQKVVNYMKATRW